MPAKRLSMRKIKEILRLKYEVGLSARRIARSCSVSRSTVSEYLNRASAVGLSWPLGEGMDEASLERLLFVQDLQVPFSKRPLPDWADIHTELRSKKSVTLMLLWEEYKACHPEDGYQYSQFCERYGKWKGALDVCMRQEHRAGEKMFIDYCGQTVGVVNPGTGEIREAEVFVAVYCGPRKRDSMLRCNCTVPERGINGPAEVYKRVQSEGSIGSD